MNGPYKLPEGWKWVRLGEVCEIIMGQSPPGHTYTEKPEGLPFFQGKADFTDYFPKVRVWCTQPIKVAEENDILISVRAPVGPVNMSNVKCCIGRGLSAIRCRDSVDNWYLFWYLRSIESQIASLGSGSTFGAITRNDLMNLYTPLPLLPEQRRIAEKLREIMSEIEKARSACERQLEAVKALPSAYLREVFESEEAKKWERRRLGEVLSIIESGSRPKGGVQEVKEGIISIGAEHLNSYGGFNFANVRFIPNAFYQTMKRGKIQKGDVLIVKDGATTGKTSIVDDDFPYKEASINEHVFRLRGKENLLTQQFLFWFLYSPQGQFQIQQEFHGSAQGGINQKFIYGVRIPLPPLPTQQRIANYLKEKMSEVEKLRQAVERQLETINALPQAYLRKAFRGEL
ncbi:MAG: restriction endonuclease subunit S [candidate division WOR-3 bacterium]